jgi:hypothetical protein
MTLDGTANVLMILVVTACIENALQMSKREDEKSLTQKLDCFVVWEAAE